MDVLSAGWMDMMWVARTAWMLAGEKDAPMVGVKVVWMVEKLDWWRVVLWS